jgi:hypothetical protein
MHVFVLMSRFVRVCIKFSKRLVGETFFAKIQYWFQKRNLKPILNPLETLKAVKMHTKKVFDEKVMKKWSF